MSSNRNRDTDRQEKKMLDGAFWFGAMGAIVASGLAGEGNKVSVDGMTLEFLTKDAMQPRISIPILDKYTEVSSSTYRFVVDKARQVGDIINAITHI